MIALDFVKALRLVHRVEVEPNGFLTQCASCAPFPSTDLHLAFNQIGDDLVVVCYGGCSDQALQDGLLFTGVPVLTTNQWRERELRRGHKREHLQERLSELLPLPEILRPPPAPPGPPAPRSFGELLALPVEPRVELCGSWLKEGSITEVYGWRGAGKSWFALWLAYCVSAGVSFMKWGVSAAKGVLYVDGEMGLEDIQARLPRIHKSESKRASRELVPDLRYFADSDLALFPDGLPNLGTPEGKALLEAHLSGVSLLILDNLSTLYNSAIENEAESWVATQDWMKGLRRRGLAVLFVHHAGKGGQQRGTSKREDLCNNVLALKQPDNHQASDGAAFTLFFEKSRGVHGPQVNPLSAKLIEDEEGELVWALHEEKDLQPQILALKEEGLGVRETARVLGISPGTVSKALARHSISRGVFPVSNPYRGDWKHLETHPSTKETPPETPGKHFPKNPIK